MVIVDGWMVIMDGWYRREQEKREKRKGSRGANMVEFIVKTIRVLRHNGIADNKKTIRQ